MKSVAIKGELRTALGKKAAREFRAEEKVPCVLYGGNEAPIHFVADAAEFRKVIYTPNVYMIDLEVSGKTYKAIVQDIQFHPVEEQILHVDFLHVFEDKPVKMDIPVKVEGFSKGMRAGGKLKLNLRRLKVKALPQDMPDFITIDITDLDLGDSFRVSQLESEKVSFVNAKSVPILAIVMTRAARAAQGTAE